MTTNSFPPTHQPGVDNLAGAEEFGFQPALLTEGVRARVLYTAEGDRKYEASGGRTPPCRTPPGRYGTRASTPPRRAWPPRPPGRAPRAVRGRPSWPRRAGPRTRGVRAVVSAVQEDRSPRGVLVLDDLPRTIWRGSRERGSFARLTGQLAPRREAYMGILLQVDRSPSSLSPSSHPAEPRTRSLELCGTGRQ